MKTDFGGYREILLQRKIMTAYIHLKINICFNILKAYK